ncbi:hypothetical protein [Methanocaldococcus sp.]
MIKKIMNLILFVLLVTLIPSTFGEVVIYKIWSPYDPPAVPVYHIDLSEQVLYLGLVNKDNYAHVVKIQVSAGGKTWTYGPVYLEPNTHVEHVVEVKVPITKDGTQKVTISLLENGKVIASKTVNVDLYFPIDVANVTCGNNYQVKDGEVCYSPWFHVFLKSNPIAKTDYQAKVWIVLKNGNNIIYNGINDSKEVYIPLTDKEVEVDFKIPELKLNKDSFTIETFVKVMNITHSVNGYEETKLVRDDNYITYNYKSYPKTFYFPVIIDKIELYNKIDNNTREYIKEFYKNIDDEELKRALNDDYFKNKIKIPRYYTKSDNVITFLKIYVKNRFNDNVKCKIILKYNNKELSKIIKLKKFEEKNVIFPIIVKPGNLKVLCEVYPVNIKTYIYEKNSNFNINPEPVAPIIIKSILVPNEKRLNDKGILVGKRYNITVTLYNIYNKTLQGTLESSVDVPNYIVNISPKRIDFKIRPYETKNINISLICYREFNGDIKFNVYAKNGVKNYKSLAHVYAYLPVIVDYVYYKPYGNVRISKVESGGLYTNTPIAGKNNKVYVHLINKLSKDLKCKVWVEFIDRDGKATINSSIKCIEIPALGEKTVNFTMFFNKGYVGYTIVHVIPEDLKNVDIIFSKGLVKLVKIPNVIKIGRYSNVDLLGNKVHTNIYLVTNVYSPISIKSVEVRNNSVIAKLENSHFPTNITVDYWVEEQNYKSKIYSLTLKPKQEKIVEIPINITNSKLRFYVKIDDFLMVDGKKEPFVIFTDLKVNRSIKMNETKSNKEKENVKVLENNIVQNNSINNSSIENKDITKNKIKNEVKEVLENNVDQNKNSGILGSILRIFSSIFSMIASIF